MAKNFSLGEGKEKKEWRWSYCFGAMTHRVRTPQTKVSKVFPDVYNWISWLFTKILAYLITKKAQKRTKKDVGKSQHAILKIDQTDASHWFCSQPFFCNIFFIFIPFVCSTFLAKMRLDSLAKKLKIRVWCQWWLRLTHKKRRGEKFYRGQFPKTIRFCLPPFSKNCTK